MPEGPTRSAFRERITPPHRAWSRGEIALTQFLGLNMEHMKKGRAEIGPALLCGPLKSHYYYYGDDGASAHQ